MAAGFAFVAAGHDDEGGKVLRFAAKAVGEPRAHAGAARDLCAGHEQRHAWRVIDGFGMHAANEGDVVRESADVRQHFAEHHAAFSVGFVRLDRGLHGPFAVAARHGGESRHAANGVGDIFSLHVAHDGFVVEKIEVRTAAALPEDDDTFGFGGEVRETGESCGGILRAARGVGAEEGAECGDAKAAGGAAEELATGDSGDVFRDGVGHGFSVISVH